MNEIPFASVLRQELRATSTAGPTGDAEPGKEIKFEQEFSRWVVSYSLAHDESAHLLLGLRDLADPEGLLGLLRNPPEDNGIVKALRDRLAALDHEQSCLVAKPKTLGQRLRHAFRAALGQDEPLSSEITPLLGSLNKLIESDEPIFGAKAQAEIQSQRERFASASNGQRTDSGVMPAAERNEQELVKSDLSKFGLDQWDTGKVDAKARKKLERRVSNRLWLQWAFPGHITRLWESAHLPVPLLFQWIHAHPQSALCLSGGGIRSATFGLGVLQGLARKEILKNFDYLSTVSGGGYIGGWLSAWSLHEGGFSKVLAELRIKCSADPLHPEVGPITHLRQFSNYLTPRLGLTSADTWTLIATYFRNLLLNWSIFIPALAAIMMVPRFSLALLHHAPPDWIARATLLLGFAGAVCSIAYAAFNRPSLKDNPLTAPKCHQAGLSRFLLYCLAPMYLSSVCFTALWVWLRSEKLHSDPLFGWYSPLQPPPLWPFLALGLGAHVVAWLIYNSRMKKGIGLELGFCLITGMLSGFLLWRGARLWSAAEILSPQLELYVVLATPWFLLSFLLGVFFFVGVSSRLTEDSDREWWARMGAWILIVLAAWMIFATLVLFGPEWLMKLPRLLAALGGVTGIITLVLTHSGLTAANRKEAAELGPKAVPATLVLAVAAPLFIAFTVAAISLGTTWAMSHVDPRKEFHGPNQLSEADIRDLPYLAARLKDHSHPVPGWIWQQLSTPLQQQLADYRGTPREDDSLRANLTSEFNELISSNSVSNATAFAQVDLSKEAKLAMLDDFRGRHARQHRQQFNLMLLQDAFHRELAQGRFDHRMITDQSQISWVVILCGTFGLVSWFLSQWININRFSLHGVYRDRLIRAYLGASNPHRKPNPFSGFDPGDNLTLTRLKRRPFHIINMALNLVRSDNLAWQQRKAESFTASPLHAGNRDLCYRYVREYAARREKDVPRSRIEAGDTGLTLGTAIAISGAAADPNMGYHSSPVLALVMTLLNVRLGAWLANPGKAGDQTCRDEGPKRPLWHLTKEAFGMTDDKQPYVYLSDGGHFENLGLYEMVLRRCRTIVVSDAGCDPNCALEDLGNAIRKIRIDLGIPIEVDPFPITSRTTPHSKYCAIGRIFYGEVDGSGRDDAKVPVGTLIYIKPAIAGDEPKDVFNYKETSPRFPHEPTSDQWFSESQFESYRALGLQTIKSITDQPAPPREDCGQESALDRFCRQAQLYLAQSTNGFPVFSRQDLKQIVLFGEAAFAAEKRTDEGN